MSRTIISAGDLVPESSPHDDGTPPAPLAGPGRPKAYYRLKANGKKERIPSVTTITDRFKNSAGLIAWAHKQGWERIPLNEARDKAADAGTITHQWIQDSIHGRPLTVYGYAEDATLASAQSALAAFRDWSDRVGLIIIATEMPMVHQELGFGGTWDAIGWVNGELVVLDWKSGNATYGEHVAQNAAYRELIRANASELGVRLPRLPEAGVLIRLDKETGKPHARDFDKDALDYAWGEVFAPELRLYRACQALDKMVADQSEAA